MTDTAPNDHTLAGAIDFLVQIEKLKEVYRQTSLISGSRRENTAEHSWHVAMAAIVLAQFTDQKIEVDHCLRLLLVHDIVEIEVGDIDVHDVSARAAVSVQEEEAAVRLFGRLDDPLGSSLLALWMEFEAGATPCARFARALDRLQPILCDLENGGLCWRERGIEKADVIAAAVPWLEYYPRLLRYVLGRLDQAERDGFFNHGDGAHGCL